MSLRPDSSQLFPDLDGRESETPTRHTLPAARAVEQERPTDTWRISGWPVRVHTPYQRDGDRERA